jgi:N-acetylmuramoyl-L-alanine amidase
MRHLFKKSGAILLCAALATSCGKKPSPPPGPELYAQLQESVEGVDTSALEEVKIVLDPGHGGRFAGAVGPEGLREADVNLGVALHLWGLLSDAGADVTLTRSSDRTVAVGEDVSLRDDLLARSSLANELQADLFISLHHNSSLSRDPGLNRIETYHKLLDPGPSADAARALHHHLSFNIGETRGGVIPGNYLVLRSCEGAAVLGEPSFISNPAIESKLKEADVQRLEASAYFLGIVDYFSKGVPRLERAAPAEGTLAGPDTAIELSAAPGGDAGIAAAGIELFLDGEPVPAHYDAPSGRVSYTPAEPVAGGTHTVEARVRNTAGNWSPTLAFTLEVETEPAHLVLNPKGAGGAPGTPRPVEVLVYDKNMNPVADGTQVVFECDRPVFPDTAYVRSGRAQCYVMTGPTGEFELKAFCGGASMGLAADPAGDEGDANTWWAFLRDEADGSPVEGAWVRIGDRQMGRSNRDGLVNFPDPEDEGGAWRVWSDGYVWKSDGRPELTEEPFGAGSDALVKVIRLERAAAGLLHGHTIVVDPEGGGDDRAGQGPSGMDAAQVNYAVGRLLARMIEGAGGTAILTRDRDGGASDVERLKLAEKAGASRYLLISHRARSKKDGPWIGHYPGSTTGASLAASIAASLETITGQDPPAIVENAAYALRQTSCAALNINLLPLSDRAAEKHLSNQHNLITEAYSIYAGLLDHLDTDGALAAGRLELRIKASGGRPAYGAEVVIDGHLCLGTDEDGAAVLTALVPGSHQVEIHSHGYGVAIENFTWPPEKNAGKKTITLQVE